MRLSLPLTLKMVLTGFVAMAAMLVMTSMVNAQAEPEGVPSAEDLAGDAQSALSGVPDGGEIANDAVEMQQGINPVTGGEATGDDSNMAPSAGDDPDAATPTDDSNMAVTPSDEADTAGTTASPGATDSPDATASSGEVASAEIAPSETVSSLPDTGGSTSIATLIAGVVVAGFGLLGFCALRSVSSQV